MNTKAPFATPVHGHDLAHHLVAFLKHKGALPFEALWQHFGPLGQATTETGVKHHCRDKVTFRIWLNNRVTSGLLGAIGEKDERMWWVADPAGSIKVQRLMREVKQQAAHNDLPRVPPRRVNVMAGDYVPRTPQVTRPGALDFKAVPSHGHRC